MAHLVCTVTGGHRKAHEINMAGMEKKYGLLVFPSSDKNEYIVSDALGDGYKFLQNLNHLKAYVMSKGKKLTIVRRLMESTVLVRVA